MVTVLPPGMDGVLDRLRTLETQMSSIDDKLSTILIILRSDIFKKDTLTTKPSKGKPKETGDAVMAGKPWSSDDESKLLAGLRTGTPIKDLAIMLKRSPGGISSRIAILMNNLASAGATPEALAAEYHLTQKYVSDAVGNKGTRVNPPPAAEVPLQPVAVIESQDDDFDFTIH